VRAVSNRVGVAGTSWEGGYVVADASGRLFTMGDAGFYGDETGNLLSKPIVGMAAAPGGGGYWEVASDGGIFAFGGAGFFGSTGSLTLSKPIVGMAAAPGGGGYWEVASDGGIFSFGDAGFFGSTGSLTLSKPVVGMAATPDGAGYWLVASDGGIFSFGDAGFFGSTGSMTLVQPVVGMAATPDGGGYWLVASDGGIFTFGDAPYKGSAVTPLRPPAYMALSSDVQPAVVGVAPEDPGPLINRSGTTRVLFIGDSVAFETGFFTGAVASGLSIFDGAILGCGIMGATPIQPWMGGGPMTPYPACDDWQQQYQWAIDGWHPNIVVFVAGYWESQPRLFNGTYADMDDNPSYASSVRSAIADALGILHSQGASIIVATAPYFGDGTPPSLINDYNAALRQVAATFGATQVLDLNTLVDPGGSYQEVVDGVDARSADGVHLTGAGVEQIVDPLLMPMLQGSGT